MQQQQVDGLGPELPMAVFTSTEPWSPERIKTLAIRLALVTNEHHLRQAVRQIARCLKSEPAEKAS